MSPTAQKPEHFMDDSREVRPTPRPRSTADRCLASPHEKRTSQVGSLPATALFRGSIGRRVFTAGAHGRAKAENRGKEERVKTAGTVRPLPSGACQGHMALTGTLKNSHVAAPPPASGTAA